MGRTVCPVAECGTRSAYSAGCRCDRCRAANTAYQAQRVARAANPTLADAASAAVDAAPVREHLEQLAAAGVGLRAVSAASGVSRSRLARLRSGEGRKVLPATRDAILAVVPAHAADRAIVDAAPTWRRVEELLAAGWTKSQITAALGHRGRGLQLGRERVTKANADRIEELWRRHVVEAQPPEGHGTLQSYRSGCRCRFCRSAASTYRSRYRSPDSGERPDYEELFDAITELAGLRAEPWRADAACAGAPVRVFFPDDGTAPHPLAVATCRRCPVAARCAAARRGDSGVRGDEATVGAASG